jgi:hypothetical protein
LFEKLDEQARARQKAALEQLKITEMPIDTWIDDDGLPRRIAFTMRPEQKGDIDFDFKGTVEFFDYGQPVGVQLPADSDVREEQPQQALAVCVGAPAPGTAPG